MLRTPLVVRGVRRLSAMMVTSTVAQFATHNAQEDKERGIVGCYCPAEDAGREGAAMAQPFMTMHSVTLLDPANVAIPAKTPPQAGDAIKVNEDFRYMCIA
jgi:hypothetical protein